MNTLPDPRKDAQPDAQEATGEATAAIEPVAPAPATDDAQPQSTLPLGALSVSAPQDYERLARMAEALLLASDQALTLDALTKLIAPDALITKREMRQALECLEQRLQAAAVELKEVASGWRIQVRAEHAEVVGRLWQDKPPKLTRALLETLALVCYRQPITRGEIEEIRGVAVSSNIIKTLLERGWIRELGVKEVPGRPTLFGTTAQLLDDLNLKTLDQLPDLPAVKDLDQLEAALSRLTLNPSAQLAAGSDEAPAEAVTIH